MQRESQPTDPPERLTAEARRARRAAAHRKVVRQRRIVLAIALLLALGAVVAIVALASGGSSSASADQQAAPDQPKPKPKPPLELPGGGRRLFPKHRIVAYYGAPQNVELGALGIGSPDAAGQRLLAQMREYRHGGRRLMPAMELIAVVAAGSAQQDGSYSYKQSFAVVKKYLKAARKIHGLLILDIQPGHANFMDLVKHFGRWLREPDVELALDPEWATPNAVPGTVIGTTDASVVNQVSSYLERIVDKYRLPDKLLLVHQFTDSMITNKAKLQHRRHVSLVLNVDGFGGQAIKIAKYHDFTHPRTGFRSGFKLFYKEDTDTMAPSQVLKLRPRPDVVIYE